MLRLPHAALLAGAFAVLAMSSVMARGIDAQERSRSAVVVDYVGAEGLYLAVGNRQGVHVGDTLVLFVSPESAEALGRIVVETATARRSVASILGPDFALAAGDVVYAVLPEIPVEAAPAAAGRPVRQTGTVDARSSADAAGPRVRGRFSLDLDVRETRTSWGGSGSASGTSTRRFGTPTSRLNLRITDLPGGWRITANARGSYRYSDGTSISAPTSLRLYDLSASKRFTSVPVEVRIGRFYNPFESYSTYWDGGLIRVGGDSGLGVGVAAGFQPDRYNQGLSQDVPKVTGFLDYAIRRPEWRYQTDVSFHLLRPRAEDLLDRSFGGWSQRLTVKRVSLDQKLQMDRNPETGTWSLTRLRLRASVGLDHRVRVHAGVVRRRSPFLRLGDLLSDAERNEGSVGLSVMGAVGSFSVDVASTGWNGEERGTAVSGSVGYRLGRVQLHGSGRRWARQGSSSLSAAPGVSFSWGSLRSRLGYQYYRTQGLTTLTSQAGDLSLSAPLSGGWRMTARIRQQWGSSFSGTYLRTSLSRSF